jgi:hypothetical protein
MERDQLPREVTPTAISSETQSSDVMPASIDQAATSTDDNQKTEDGTIKWDEYKDEPVINLLEIDSSNQMQTASRTVIHFRNLYGAGNDQLKPLHRHVRQLAMNPESTSHYIMLASLEAMQREIDERKGSGLINFEEFEVHMQNDKLGFLGSWMEWVSI